VLPTSHPLGHLLGFRSEPLALFTRAMNEVGDVVRVRSGPVHIMFAFHPDDIEHVLLRNAAAYGKRTRGYGKMRLVLGDGLLTSEGAKWKRQRRTVNPAFHARSVASFTAAMGRAAEGQMAAWRSRADTGEVFDIARDLSALTLKIVGETLFGTGFETQAPAIAEALDEVLFGINRLTSSPWPAPERWPTPNNRRFHRAIRTLDQVVTELVTRRLRDPEDHPDLLGMLLAARDEETGEPMDARTLRDELVTLILAGHETTANALAWSFYLLSRNPGIARKAREEAQDLLGGRAPTPEQLAALPYTRQVLHEALRLYPPAWVVGRNALQDDVLGGFSIPKNTFVYLSPYATHRHPALWEDPEGFDPDRFAPERAAGRHKLAWFPFSAGRRKCLGDRFAETEALVVLATVLQHLRLDLLPGHRVRPHATVTLRPRGGLPMRMHDAARGLA